MHRQIGSALALGIAFAVLMPGMDAAARAFGDYTLALPPLTHLWQGDNPGDGEPTPSLPSVHFEPQEINLPFAFPLPPVMVVPVPRIDMTGACGPAVIATLVEVTEYPKRADKNGSVTLGGTLVEGTGAAVDGGEVELFVNETKEEPGVLLGRTFSNAIGRWTLVAPFPVALEAQRYHLVAHALEHSDGCRSHAESWSDPEIDVHAQTRLTLTCPERLLAGRDERCEGALLDDVGAPVPARGVRLTADGRPLPAVSSDGGGLFPFTLRFDAPGTYTVSAAYAGEKYYRESERTIEVVVVRALVEIEAPTVVVAPNGEVTVRGRVVAVGDLPEGPLTLDAAGLDAPREIQFGKDGTFEVKIRAPAGTPVGERTLALAAPWLDAPQRFVVRVIHDTVLTLEAPDRSSAWREYEAVARLTTGAGEPLPDRAIFLTLVERPHAGPDARFALTGITDREGYARFAIDHARWGDVELNAAFPGTEDAQPARASPEFVSLALPWWVIALVLVSTLALADVAFEWARRARALRPLPPLPGVPPLLVRFPEAADDVPWIAGVGETVLIEADLPRGTARLHVIAPRHVSAPTLSAVNGDASARVALTVKAKGERATRIIAEDAGGRPLAAADVGVRGVLYAEEIERAYAALVSASDASPELVTPREFETLLRARPGVARGPLGDAVTLFEIADYSSRKVERDAFLAFRAARQSIGGGDDASA